MSFSSYQGQKWIVAILRVISLNKGIQDWIPQMKDMYIHNEMAVYVSDSIKLVFEI